MTVTVTCATVIEAVTVTVTVTYVVFEVMTVTVTVTAGKPSSRRGVAARVQGAGKQLQGEQGEEAHGSRRGHSGALSGKSGKQPDGYQSHVFCRES